MVCRETGASGTLTKAIHLHPCFRVCLFSLGTSYAFHLECSPCKFSLDIPTGSDDPSPPPPATATTSLLACTCPAGLEAGLIMHAPLSPSRRGPTSVSPSSSTGAGPEEAGKHTGNNCQIVSSPMGWVDQGSQPDFPNIPSGECVLISCHRTGGKIRRSLDFQSGLFLNPVS